MGKINPRKLHESYLDSMENSLKKDYSIELLDTSNALHMDDDYMSLPPDITNVSSRELGEYLNYYTQQKVYLRTALCRCECQLEWDKRQYYASTEDLYKTYSSSKMSETAKERIINSDPAVKEAYFTFRDSRIKRDMVASAIANVEDIIFMLSREVTRRNSEFERNVN